MIPFVKDAYKTDAEQPRSIFSRLFLSPRFTFYPQAIWIIWKYSRKAMRGRYPAEMWAESSYEIVQALENIGTIVEITGLDNIRRCSGPAVFIGNHMSTLETLVLPCIIQPIKDVTFVVKQSLVDTPVFGPIMRSRNPVLVSRTRPREDLKTVLEGGTERLRQGQSIVIFPQSTRSFRFDPAEFNTLGIKLALRANVPVIPIALKTDAWGIGRMIKEFGPIDPEKKVRFAFGEPFTILGRGSEEHQKVVDFIAGHLAAWEQEAGSDHPQ